ncbi:MAG TPA: hypothetical protein VJQ83_12605 [Tepidiformaceae bacterium]|nr:hypothetical protein [Tepidiformaceae bacterium]
MALPLPRHLVSFLFPVEAGESPGVRANERLTAMAGAALFILLAVEGVTIVQVHQLFSVHVFVGVMLLGPLTVKLGSTGYRFIRYYTHADAYRQKGPPIPLLRLLAPILVASTLVVFGTGVALLAVGPHNSGQLVFVHRVSFFVWFGVMTVHVLAYVWRIPGDAKADWRKAPDAPWRRVRLGINLGGLAAGAIAAALVLPAAQPWLTRFTEIHH